MRLSLLLSFLMTSYCATAQTVSIVNETLLADGSKEITAEVAMPSAANNLAITVGYDKNAVKAGSAITVVCNGTATDNRANGELTIVLASAPQGVVAQAKIIIENVLERGDAPKSFSMMVKEVKPLLAAITVLPNVIKANGSIGINSTSGLLRASFYSLEGKLLSTVSFDGSTVCETLSPDLSTGYFLLEIITVDGNRVTQKIRVD